MKGERRYDTISECYPSLRACSSGDRATVSGAVCRRFESFQARSFEIDQATHWSVSTFCLTYASSYQKPLVLNDNPYRMNYARDIAKDRQQDVDPELLANTHLQEHA